MFHLDLGGLQDSTPHSTSSSKGLRRLSVLTRNQKKQLLNSAEKSATSKGQINDEFTPLSKPLATLHETPVSSGTRKRKSLMSFPSNTSNNESSSTKKKNKRRASVSPLGGPIVQTRNQRRTSQLVPMMETIGEVASLPTTSSSAAKKQFASARDIQLRARWLFGEQGAFDKDEVSIFEMFFFVGLSNVNYFGMELTLFSSAMSFCPHLGMLQSVERYE